jgi:hypothetical protein
MKSPSARKFSITKEKDVQDMIRKEVDYSQKSASGVFLAKCDTWKKTHCHHHRKNRGSSTPKTVKRPYSSKPENMKINKKLMNSS